MAAENEENTNSEPKEKRLKETTDEKHSDDNKMLDTDEIVKKNQGLTAPNPQSKRQMKKQKKLAEYTKYKKERRLQERQKRREKRAEALEKGLTRTGPSRKELKRRQTEAAAGTNADSLQVAIDLDYDDLMSEIDISKCIKQCLRIYTINRRSEKSIRIHLTGIKSDGPIHNVLKKNDGWENWNVIFHFDETHIQAFPSEQLVYLTCESDVVLKVLEPNFVYVAGGLVDHNHYKGLCHKRATDAGIKTARLPLSEHVDMKTRAVLSTYHVFEILLHVAEGKSWTDAILQTLPMRKGAKPKHNNETQILNEAQTTTALDSTISNEDCEAKNT